MPTHNLTLRRILNTNNINTLLIANTNKMPWLFVYFDGVYNVENIYFKLQG